MDSSLCILLKISQVLNILVGFLLKETFCQIFFLLVVQCDDPDADFEQICGFGATGCLGNAIAHTCQCNADLPVKLSSDGGSCVPGKKSLFFQVTVSAI